MDLREATCLSAPWGRWLGAGARSTECGADARVYVPAVLWDSHRPLVRVAQLHLCPLSWAVTGPSDRHWSASAAVHGEAAGPGRPWSEPLLWGWTLGLGSRAGGLSTCTNCSVEASSDRNPRNPDHLAKQCEPNAIFRQVDPKRKGRGRPELCLPGSCSGTFYQISCPIFLGVEGGQGCRTNHLPVCGLGGRRRGPAVTT